MSPDSPNTPSEGPPADSGGIGDREQRRRIRAWQMYDWANSAFAVVIITAFLPIYFSHVSTSGLSQENKSMATSIWAATAAISMALVAVAALLLGPVADASARKKRYLSSFLILSVGATAMLAICPPTWWWAILLLFIAANFGFGAGNVFYDAMLPAVSPPDKIDQVSSTGYALGYLGGGLLLALCVGLTFFLPKQTVAATGEEFPVVAMRIAFIAVAVWWALFSIPLFRRVPEAVPKGAGRDSAPSIGVRQAWKTIKSLAGERDLLLFLLAFWLYSDGFGTIIKIAGIFGSEIFRENGVDSNRIVFHLTVAILLVQFVGMPCTLLWGRIAKTIGAKRSILICLAIYSLICVFGYYLSEIWHFYVLGLSIALVQGGTQALSRSYFAALVPRGREAEFFGLYNISGKFAGVIGPLMFAVIGYFMGSSRPAILGLIVFFVLGGFILAKVNLPNRAEQG